MTPERESVLNALVSLISVHPGPRTLVGVDGRSGAGKSTLADELATRLARQNRTTVRSTTDSFHRPRAERLRLGPASAEGYYRDSHQLDVIVGELLTPFAQGAPRVRTAAFDEPSDSPVEEFVAVDPKAVLLFDGLFVQRPELNDHWDVVIFVDAALRRDDEWLAFLLDGLPDDVSERAAAIDARLSSARWPRYRDGWRIYADAVSPASSAAVVVDNNDVRRPAVVERN